MSWRNANARPVSAARGPDSHLGVVSAVSHRYNCLESTHSAFVDRISGVAWLLKLSANVVVA